jgi:hypothetical protein
LALDTYDVAENANLFYATLEVRSWFRVTIATDGDLTWLLPYDRVRVSLDKQVPSPKSDKLSFRMGL